MTRAPIDDGYDSDGDMPLPARVYRLAWTLTSKVVMWLKALASILLIIGGTVTDSYQLVDLQGYAKNIFGDSVKLPTIIAGLTISYLALTLLLKLPKGFSANAKQNDGD